MIAPTSARSELIRLSVSVLTIFNLSFDIL
jgi:hypothetical protein